MLTPARAKDRDIIASLLQEYLQEMSEYTAVPSDEDGFVYPFLDFYWREPDRHPFLVVSQQIGRAHV